MVERRRLVVERGRDVVIAEGHRVSLERRVLSENELRASVLVCAAGLAIAWALGATPAIALLGLLGTTVVAAWLTIRLDALRVGVTRPLAEFDVHCCIAGLRGDQPRLRLDEVDLAAFNDASGDGFELRSSGPTVRVLVSRADQRSLLRAATELRALGVPVSGLPEVAAPYRRGLPLAQ